MVIYRDRFDLQIAFDRTLSRAGRPEYTVERKNSVLSLDGQQFEIGSFYTHGMWSVPPIIIIIIIVIMRSGDLP